MLVFIDESGDAGLKLDGGSSEFFVVTFVVFTDHDVAARADRCIDGLKKRLNYRKETEFKFNKSSPRIRTVFLEALAKFKFEYFSVIVNKKELAAAGFRYKDSFYKYACKLACLSAQHRMNNAIVVIDGSGSREFRQQMHSFLKRNINESSSSQKRIKKVKMRDSKKNNLHQLADMVCGAVARSYKDKSDAL